MNKMSKRFYSIWILFALAVPAALLLINAGYSSEKISKNNDSEWPQWRGPNRDGISSEKGLFKTWPAEGPKTLWRIAVGEGYSGMAVANGKLFTSWNEGNSQFLFCFEASSGKELWRHRIGEYFLNQYGNGPRSTPVVDGTIVYVVSAQGRLDAVDLTNGRPRWSHDLAAEYGGQIPSIGYSSSPLVDDEKLIVEVGGKDGFAFAAFNKRTGELLWHSQTDLPAYSSPILATINGTRQVVFLSAEGLFAVSPENGSLYWQYSWKTLCPATGIPLNTATPIFIAPNKIFISSGYGTVSGAAVIQLREIRKQFVAETLWSNQDMKNLVNSSVFFENHIYGFDDGIFKCLDAATGKEKWKARGFERGSLIFADGHLIVLGERGKLALVEATPEAFKEVASVEILDGKCWTSPTLANGKLYLRNQKEMVCLALSAK